MPSWQGRFPASPETVGIIRSEIAALARDCGLQDAAISDVKLAVTEAATNAIQHAYGDGPAGDVAATACTATGVLRIVISDDGHGVFPRVNSPGLGLGLPLIAAVAKSFKMVSKPEGGTEMQITFPCPAAQGS